VKVKKNVCGVCLLTMGGCVVYAVPRGRFSFLPLTLTRFDVGDNICTRVTSSSTPAGKGRMTRRDLFPLPYPFPTTNRSGYSPFQKTSQLSMLSMEISLSFFLLSPACVYK